MHNIRKMKKKRKNKQLNPEELAQDKLYEISRFQDQEDEFSESPQFIEKPKHKPNHSLPVTPNRSLPRTQLPFFCNEFDKKSRLNSAYSTQEMKNKSMELTEKKPIALINYILIDRRQEKTEEEREEKQDTFNMIKRKMATRRLRNQISTQPATCYSYDLRRLQKPVQKVVKSISNSIVCALQVKNVKMFNKYPFFP